MSEITHCEKCGKELLYMVKDWPASNRGAIGFVMYQADCPGKRLWNNHTSYMGTYHGEDALTVEEVTDE